MQHQTEHIKHSMHKGLQYYQYNSLLASLEVYVLLALGGEAVSHCGPACQTVGENKTDKIMLAVIN